MAQNAVAKFKVGDKVKVVKGGWGIADINIGRTTTILDRGDDYEVIGVGMMAQYHVDVGPLSDQGVAYNVTEHSFELVEEKAEAVVAEPEKLMLEINYNGITVKFDPSVRSGEWLAQSVISTIYKEAQV